MEASCNPIEPNGHNADESTSEPPHLANAASTIELGGPSPTPNAASEIELEGSSPPPNAASKIVLGGPWKDLSTWSKSKVAKSLGKKPTQPQLYEEVQKRFPGRKGLKSAVPQHLANILALCPAQYPVTQETSSTATLQPNHLLPENFFRENTAPKIVLGGPWKDIGSWSTSKVARSLGKKPTRPQLYEEVQKRFPGRKGIKHAPLQHLADILASSPALYPVMPEANKESQQQNSPDAAGGGAAEHSNQDPPDATGDGAQDPPDAIGGGVAEIGSQDAIAEATENPAALHDGSIHHATSPLSPASQDLVGEKRKAEALSAQMKASANKAQLIRDLESDVKHLKEEIRGNPGVTDEDKDDIRRMQKRLKKYRQTLSALDEESDDDALS